MRKALLGVIFVSAIVCSVCAQETREETEKTIEYPSPDGRFAFLFTRPPEGRKTLDVVEKDSGKVLRRIVESDESFGDRLDAEVIWTPDSKRFAVTYMLNRRGSGISICSRTGNAFRELKLPNLPSVELPANSGDGKITNVDSTSAVRWEKNGSLVVEIETTKSRAEDVITATRTIVLGFDQRDRVKILRSTQKVTTEKD
jgi:hypothetical protein